MSAKNLDSKGRFRSKIVSFRMSPAEGELLDSFVRCSGMNKQDYILSRVLQSDVTVKGNIKAVKGISNELSAVYRELKRINCGENISDETINLIEFIAKILAEMVVEK